MDRIPEKLEELVFRYRGHTGGLKQHDLDESVAALSDSFNGVKPRIAGYLSKKKLRQSYVCYYLAIGYAKVREVLRELKGFAKLPEKPLVLDFGSGPGSAALAASDELENARITVVDVVQEALDDASWLLSEYSGRDPRRATSVPDLKYDVAVAANVLSELNDERPLLRILEENVTPEGYLVVIEPALPQATRRLMTWRDELTAAGWKIAAPCMNVTRCPMRDRGDLWCHQDRPWKKPGFVDSVDRRLGFDKESLKYSYLIVTKAGKTRSDASPGAWRVVSNRHRSKGRLWTSLCGTPGMIEAELLTRHRSEDTADFEHCRRGEVLTISPTPSGRMAPGTVIRKS